MSCTLKEWRNLIENSLQRYCTIMIKTWKDAGVELGIEMSAFYLLLHLGGNEASKVLEDAIKYLEGKEQFKKDSQNER